MNVYEEYALLKAKMAELENKEDELRTKILEEMVEKGEEKIETTMGSFKKTMIKTWEYPPEVYEKEEDYKAEKVKAQNNETATYTEKPSLRFTPMKL